MLEPITSHVSSFLHSDFCHRLDAVIDGALVSERLVGAVVLASQDGSAVYRRAAGLADREAGIHMREDSIFRLASVSKLFVATAAMALVDRGRIALDVPVADFLPTFKPRLADGRAASMTIRQLLTHTSGLSYGFLESKNGPYHRAKVSDGMDRSGLSLEENLRRLASVPLLFEPGTAWNYSLSIDVLGAVIEKVTGLSLADAVRNLVTKPVALAESGFTVTDPTRLATAYADGSRRPRRMKDDDLLQTMPGLADVAMSPTRAFDSDAFPSGGAGMVGTADDTLRLLEALRLGGDAILSQERVRDMGSNQIGALPVAGWPGWGHGLGFSVLLDPTTAGTPETEGTWRWGGAYGHSWFVDPSEKLTVVAFTNTAFEGMSGGGRFPQDLCRAIYDR
ncbi:serine hydrolase domain-containing protein [Rhizobium rhizogenes]|uniref:serine hydrolase domain-containing protein n=1 Tax=Rhizobium rhizogenes TaxID=359 RepID=UPI001573EF30|nr:serine hydrolase domain-containing protein [Rhizobium rhizogenes]NTF96092.1 beta-lactamase family protein [Rhizobium rhizogenes]